MFVGEQSEEHLFVNEFRAEGVDHADGARFVGVEQRVSRFQIFEKFIDEQPAVYEIYFVIAASQLALSKFEFVGADDLGIVSIAAEELLKLLELALSRQPFQIYYRDIRFSRVRAAPFFICAEQRVEQVPASIERGYAETLCKTL